jgi:hypothetical protein
LINTTKKHLEDKELETMCHMKDDHDSASSEGKARYGWTWGMLVATHKSVVLIPMFF